MLHATSSLMEGLEQWLRALQSNDFAAARNFAEHFNMHGDLLAVHPDFVRCFEQHTNGADPREIILYMQQFLMCATRVREHAVSRSGG